MGKKTYEWIKAVILINISSCSVLEPVVSRKYAIKLYKYNIN